jgi:NAD-dependent DNA ligase
MDTNTNNLETLTSLSTFNSHNNTINKKINKKIKCKNKTRKYKLLGDGCYSNEEIKAFQLQQKLAKKQDNKNKTQTKTRLIKTSPIEKKLNTFNKEIKIQNKCKNKTRKFKVLGDGCYTKEEINAYLLQKRENNILQNNLKKQNIKTKNNKKSNTKSETIDEKILVPPTTTENEFKENKIEILFSPENNVNKSNLNTSILIDSNRMEQVNKIVRYNESFIDLLEKLSGIMLKQGEPFRARAYQNAQETIMIYPNDITDPNQLKDLPGIGSTILDKLNEYVKTGTLRVLEREKSNPIIILGEVYGIGPKKAQELMNAGINNLDDLRLKQNEYLTEIQKVGLKYYDQIQQRIPRNEIDEYQNLFTKEFEKVANDQPDAKFEIVGSYRRGAMNSGDIDVIITGKNSSVYKNFIDNLFKMGVIVQILSRGPSKTLVIAKLPGERVARRVDFLYAPPDEFAFAILYFTGSKIFNTVMRQKALDQGYTFNEHGIYKMENKKKGKKIEKEFKTEKDIFDFLGLKFKTPKQRKDGRAVKYFYEEDTDKEIVDEKEETGKNNKEVEEIEEVMEIIPVKKAKTLKKKIVQKEKEEQELLKNSVKNDNNDFANKNEINKNIKTKTIKVKKSKKNMPELIEVMETQQQIPDQLKEENAKQWLQDFSKDGIKVLESLNENQLTQVVQLANKYYTKGEPLITDNQYDIIQEYIMEYYPNNKTIKEIGSEVERNKAKLPYEMGSMDKIKPDSGALNNWTQKYSGPYIISCKLDGISGLYSTEGKEAKLYTRGNGTVGQDISHLIPYLRLPKTKGIVIRGELIIPKVVFIEKYKTKFANPRNMVAGIVNQKSINDAVVDLHFVAYEVIKPEKIPSKQMEYLETINVERVLYTVSEKISNELLSHLLVEWRRYYMYEIDGIIVTNDKLYPRKSGNPEHSFAFKMVLTDQIVEAKVVDVIWTPSKDGYLKPRVQIEPMNVGGVKIEYATGFNASFIMDNKIGIGATIELIRSGDVIPHIKSVIVKAPEAKMPDVPYKWNETKVDILLENILNDPIVKEKNVAGFFKGIEVEGLSSGNVSRLIAAGYDTVPKILQMSESDFLTVEGFKSKMAKKLSTGIKEKIKEANIITLMAASNIFGRGFSEKKMELVLDDIPDILVSNAKYNDKVKQVEKVKGMANKSAEALVSKIEDFKIFLKECDLEYKLTEKPEKEILDVIDVNNALYGKNVIITGTRDKNLMDILKKLGATVGSNVNKNTYMVIAKNAEDDTTKAEEARKLNIPIISVFQFNKVYVQQ